MQSSARTYFSDGRTFRYRYRAVTRGGAGLASKVYVNIGSARRTLERIRGTWPDAELQRIREYVDDHCNVLEREYELERDGSWTTN